MTRTIKRLAFASLLFASITSTGCGDDAPPVDPDPDAPDQPPAAILKGPSRSGTIAVSDDRARVAMVNPEDGTLSVFQTSDNARTAKVAVGRSPSAVVIAADSKTAFVANREDGTVVRVTGIDGGTPAVDKMVTVGAEPVALALSPTGRFLFVAEYAQSRVSVLDSTTLETVRTHDVDRPRALLVTNNLDQSDDDESLVVPQFFGTPVAGKEAKDDGRTGLVKIFKVSDGAAREITLAPTDSGFPRGGVAGAPTVLTSPNQLGAVAIAPNGRLYITSVSASPEPPARFDNNVYPVVYVADLAAGTEITGGGGTTNLAKKIVDAVPTGTAAAPRFIPGDLSDIAFLDTSAADAPAVGYALGKGGDVLVRTVWSTTTEIGSTQNKLIDLAGNDTIGRCQNPTGIAIDPDSGKAYINCWISRRMAVVSFADQAMTGTFEASPAPVGAAAISVQKGKRFYFTGRGRWSNAGGNGAKGGEGWSSCGSCHPDGLTDNITWVFAAGPRQTTSQDGTFSHGTGPQKQRIMNWTGIFEEHHDFERNTRDVSGGLGVITTAPSLADCNQLDKETPVSLAGIGGLQRPLKELQDDAATAICGHKEWDDIDNYVKTIQPTKAKVADQAAIDRGRAAFVEGNCARCHGGAGWTASRVFFAPSQSGNSTLAATAFTPPAFFPATWTYLPRTQIGGQPVIAADATGPEEATAVGIGQAACVLRNVGTFGVPGNTDATNALEQRPTPGGLLRAQGRGGYNIPSLYGLSLGAPYLHHGQAPTLESLLTDTKWAFHTNAGNANFSVALGSGSKLADLVAFLLSIDATTAEIALPTDVASGGSFDACP